MLYLQRFKRLTNTGLCIIFENYHPQDIANNSIKWDNTSEDNLQYISNF